jgi:hypothetical protein
MLKKIMRQIFQCKQLFTSMLQNICKKKFQKLKKLVDEIFTNAYLRKVKPFFPEEDSLQVAEKR